MNGKAVLTTDEDALKQFLDAERVTKLKNGKRKEDTEKEVDLK